MSPQEKDQWIGFLGDRMDEAVDQLLEQLRREGVALTVDDLRDIIEQANGQTLSLLDDQEWVEALEDGN